MRIAFDKHPVTLIFCMIWSAIAFFFIILDISNPLRIILSIPIIIFIPGHVLICALFPTKKTDKGIDFTERIALSLGVSLAIVPLFGIVLNYTPWGLKLQPIILSLEAFILIMGSIAIIRWFNTPPSNRFTLTINISAPKHESRLDKTLTVILVVTLIIALSLVVYVAITPKEVEKFTEFYYTASGGTGNEYLRDIVAGENASIIIGIANHEYRTINYTVEVWLVNQTTIYNETSNKNETVYNNVWFMDKINITLEHKPINLEEAWSPQWEYNYTFNITHLGDFNLVFLLYTSPTPPYSVDTDYKTIAEEKVDSESTTAYRDIHLRLNVV
jgi:uncharacterized membrane protein